MIAGGLPAGLPGPEALPRRRPVHDLALPDHRQLRVHLPRTSGPGTATTSSATSCPSIADCRPEADPEATVEVGGSATASTVALRSLPPRLRAVVVLRDVYDLPHEAIAAELGISVSAAKVRLHRARRTSSASELVPPCPDERADEVDVRAV